MRSLILTIALALLVAAPAVAGPQPGPQGGGPRFEDQDGGRKDKPVIIIKGKGGTVTKVKKPEKKK